MRHLFRIRSIPEGTIVEMVYEGTRIVTGIKYRLGHHGYQLGYRGLIYNKRIGYLLPDENSIIYLDPNTRVAIEGMMMMPIEFDDGGRAAAGYRGIARDCVVRAIAIATERPYRDVYSTLFAMNKKVCGEYKISQGARNTSPRDANTSERTVKEYMESFGWVWTSTMPPVNCKYHTHLRAGELPSGRLAVSISHHLVAVIDGIIHDTHDPSDGGKRCVHGFWQKG